MDSSAGRIFISYRREDTAYPAGWLYDRLAERYGDGQVFKDIDSIELGDDFVQRITDAVGSCDVLLALVGSEWLTVTEAQGRRRLDDPDDFVRLEIEAALTRDVRVIPILVEGAAMPPAAELPPTLARLVRRQALELSPARFEFDTSRLIKVIDSVLAEVRTPPPSTASRPGPPKNAAGPTGVRLARRAWILGGTGGVAALMLLAFLLIREPDPAGSAAPGSDADERTSAGAPTTGTTEASSTGSSIFEDDFSGSRSGWEVIESPGKGFETDGAYRISVRATEFGSSPWSAPTDVSAVFPSAPPDVAVQVDARKVSGDADTGYGIGCRASANGAYVFAVWGESNAELGKLLDHDPWYLPLAGKKLSGATFEAGAANQMRATCKKAADGEAVHLVFSVNGEVVAEKTDSDQPLETGTVGLFVPVGEDDAATAEFDNFVVTKD